MSADIQIGQAIEVARESDYTTVDVDAATQLLRVRALFQAQAESGGFAAFKVSALLSDLIGEVACNQEAAEGESVLFRMADRFGDWRESAKRVKL